jgi:hypothetical protein
MLGAWIFLGAWLLGAWIFFGGWTFGWWTPGILIVVGR